MEKAATGRLSYLFILVRSGRSLCASGRVAKRVVGIQEDLTGDDSVIVDPSGHVILRARIGDGLEDAVFVDEPAIVISIDVVADDHSRIVDARECGSILRFRGVNRGKFSILPEKSGAYPAARRVAHDRVVVIDRHGIGHLLAGIGDAGVLPVDEQESIDGAGASVAAY